MTHYKIPGMSYTVSLSQSGGRHSLKVLLKESEISSANLQSYSREGIKVAMEKALKQAEIHIPTYTIEDLTDKLFDASGYLESDKEVSKEGFEDQVIEKLSEIEERLARIEKKLGV